MNSSGNRDNRHAQLCRFETAGYSVIALMLATWSVTPSEAATALSASSSPSAEDAFRQQVVSTPPSADPRDFNGVWWPDRSFAQQRPTAKLKPGVLPPAQQLGPSLNNSIVKCMPAIRFDGIGSGMSELYVQGPAMLTIIAEEDHDIRQVYLDRALPKKPKPSLTGYSVGHWDGDTLVIETVGLKDPNGTVRSSLRVTERLRKVRDANYLEHTVTFDDPTRYIEPYTFVWAGRWRPDIRIAENICEEEYEDYKVENGSVKYSDDNGSVDKGNDK